MLCRGFQILTEALLLVVVYSLDTDTSSGKKASVPRLIRSSDVDIHSLSHRRGGVHCIVLQTISM